MTIERLPITDHEQWLGLRPGQRRRNSPPPVSAETKAKHSAAMRRQWAEGKQTPAKHNPRALFERHWIPEPNSGCWLWTGAVARFGHGSFRHEGKTAVAHRVAWKLYRGPIPADLQVCHHCDVACCVKPDHLFLGTQKDNLDDCASKGRRPDTSGEMHP